MLDQLLFTCQINSVCKELRINQLYIHLKLLDIYKQMKKIFNYLIEWVSVYSMLGTKDQVEKQSLLRGKESMSF